MLSVNIVGYGFAGQNLHHHCLSKLRALGWTNVIGPEVVVVDPAMTAANLKNKNVLLQDSLLPISANEASYRVLHVCSPPQSHFDVVKTALACGYRQIIVEKPAVSTIEQLRQLRALERFYDAKILTVANWVSSATVAELGRCLETNRYGEIKNITIVQNKSRYMRSRQRCNEHVFDVEMPHQVALALFLGGPAAPEFARTEDMLMPDMCIPNLGQGRLTLRHNNGIISQLYSSLTHTSRERYLEVFTHTGHRLMIAFPPGGDDSYSRLRVYSPAHNLLVDQLIQDDPLTLCFVKAYQYFISSQQNPNIQRPNGMSLDFNDQKVEIIERAKMLAAINSLHNNAQRSDVMQLKVRA